MSGDKFTGSVGAQLSRPRRCKRGSAATTGGWFHEYGSLTAEPNTNQRTLRSHRTGGTEIISLCRTRNGVDCVLSPNRSHEPPQFGITEYCCRRKHRVTDGLRDWSDLQTPVYVLRVREIRPCETMLWLSNHAADPVFRNPEHSERRGDQGYAAFTSIIRCIFLICSIRQRFRRRYLPDDQPGEMKLAQDDATSAWQDHLSQRNGSNLDRDVVLVLSRDIYQIKAV